MNFADDERIIVKDIDYIVDHFTGQKRTFQSEVLQKKQENGEWVDIKVLGPKKQ